MKTILHILLLGLVVGSVTAKKLKNAVEVCGLDMIKIGNGIEKLEKEDMILGDDVILTPEQQKAKSKKGKDSGKRAVSRGNTVYWPVDKPVYYSLDQNVPDGLKNKIEEAMEVIEKYTCISFTKVAKSDQEKYHINFVKVGLLQGAKSNIGKTQGTFGSSRFYQAISLPAMITTGSIIHEIMHTLGFIHEQERPDRDEYIDIHWDNIQEGKDKNFLKEPDANTFGEPYDFNSIMHYGSKYMGKSKKELGNDGKEKTVKLVTITAKEVYGGAARDIGSKGSLTDSDIRRLNKLFMCSEPNAQQMQEAIVVMESKEPEELIQESKPGDIINGPCEKEKTLHKDD